MASFQRIIFDISDVVKYSIGNSSVSGIQRVQLKIISNLSYIRPDQCFVSFFNEAAGAFELVRAADLGLDEDFDSEKILARLGLLRSCFFPEKFSVKRYLKSFEANKVRRSWEKAKVYYCAVFMRDRLRRHGILSGLPASGIHEAPRTPLELLPRSDLYLLLGSFWDYAEVMGAAKDYKKRGGDVVALIHDLIPLVASDFSTSGLNRVFSSFVYNIPDIATKILAVSRCTAQDVLKVLGKRVGNVEVLPLAHEFSGSLRNPASTASLRDSRDDPYALCVGTIEIRKNGIMLLRAWARLIEEGISVPRLVFAGKFGWRISNFKSYLSENGAVAKKVTLINSPNDTDLAALYGGAKFCLFPSFYEGWGLPVGEAAWFGRYVIASSAASVPEVCGDLMDYADPDDLNAWVGFIKRAILDVEYVNSREARISSSPLRSWRDVAVDLDAKIMSI